MGDQFGAIFSPWQLETAVVNTLQGVPPGGQAPRLVYYLAAVERAVGLAPQTLPVPPGPSSYRNDADTVTQMAEWFPMVHVVCKLLGDGEWIQQGVWQQRYTLEVTATFGDDDPDWARQVAGHYSVALARAIADYGSLGIGATHTRLVRGPTPAEFLNAGSARQVSQSTVRFETLVAPALVVSAPLDWAFPPYTSGAFPTVETITISTGGATGTVTEG
jgi:hypothetical protein